MSKFFKQLFCFHDWTSNILEAGMAAGEVIRAGTSSSILKLDKWHICKKCRKQKAFDYDYVQIKELK